MKKTLFILALGGLLTVGCSSNAKDNTKQDITNTAVEKPETSNDGGTELLSKERFINEVWNYNESPQEWKYLGNKPAIIDFYADWCGPCRIASPILEEISTEYAGKIKIYKIDTQRERELASVFGIRSIPAFLYIPVQGKPVMMSGIGQSKEETRSMFIDNINKHLLNK